MTHRQKVIRNRIIVFGVVPALIIFSIIFIRKKPADERGVEVPEGLQLNDQGFLEEKEPEGPTIEDETVWATAENGMPAGWVIWPDTISGSAVEKYAPSKGLSSYVIKVPKDLVQELMKPNKCTQNADPIVFCVVGNNPDVERYFRVLEYYYSAE